MTDQALTAVKSADRVLDLFELLAEQGREMSHADISQALEIPKSSLTQLLKNLAARGYIEYLATSKSYRLSARFGELALAQHQRRNILTLAASALERITGITRESAALNLLKGGMAEVVVTTTSTMRLVSHMRLGDVAPLYATSAGKVLLSFSPDGLRQDYLTTVTFEKFTPKTLSAASDLRKEIDEIRLTGVGYSFEEFTPGIVGIAVPLLVSSEKLLGAINIAMPAVRYSTNSKNVAIEALKEAAFGIAQQLLETA